MNVSNPKKRVVSFQVMNDELTRFDDPHIVFVLLSACSPGAKSVEGFPVNVTVWNASPAM
jgi:hypothetical protein